MKEELQNILSETYQKGYAHGIEDTKDMLKMFFETYIQNNLNLEESHKELFQGLVDVLVESAKDVEKKVFKDYDIHH